MIAGGLAVMLGVFTCQPRTTVTPASATVLTLGGGAATFYNVNDFASVQAALDEIPDNSRLYFPKNRGPYQPPDTAGWQIRKHVEIFGDGADTGEDVGLQPYNLSKNGTVFQLRGSLGNSLGQPHSFYLHDITISNDTGAPAANGVGDYIRVATDTLISGIWMERVTMFYAGRSAIYLPGADYVVGSTLRNVKIFGCGGHGIFMASAAQLEISSCSSTQNKGMGAVLSACGNGLSITASDFESNGYLLDGVSDITIPEDYGVSYNAQLYLVICDGSVMSCNIEAIADADSVDCRHGITLNSCRGMVLGGSEIDGTPTVTNCKGINLINGSRGNTILSNAYSSIKYTVYIDAAIDYGNTVLSQWVYLPPSNVQPGIANIPAASYNFAVIMNQSLTGATNKVVGILLPAVATNGNAPDSLTDAYSTILQKGLLVNTTNDSLFLRRTTGWSVK